MFFDLFVKAVEYGLLKAAVEAAEVDVEKHGDAANLAGFAEVEEIIFEVLISPHGHPLSEIASGTSCPRNDGWALRGLAMTVFTAT